MFPRWLSWIFLLFLAYVLARGDWRQPVVPEEAPAATLAEQAPQDYPEIRALMDGQRWRKVLNPQAVDTSSACTPLPVTDARISSYAIVEEEGVGDPATCGGTIHLRLQLWDAAGAPKGAAHEKTLTLGAQPGLDALLLGMQPHARRTLLFAVPKAGYATLPFLTPGKLAVLTVVRYGPEEAP